MPGAGTEGWISRCCSSPRGGGGWPVRVWAFVRTYSKCVCVQVTKLTSLSMHALQPNVCVCLCVCTCQRAHEKVCAAASTKCLRERHLQKASGKESQNNKGNLASSDVLRTRLAVVHPKVSCACVSGCVHVPVAMVSTWIRCAPIHGTFWLELNEKWLAASCRTAKDQFFQEPKLHIVLT